MAGSATLTTVLSMKAMLDPRMVAASTQVLASAAHGVSIDWVWMTASSQGVFMQITGPLAPSCGFEPQCPERLPHVEIRLRSVGRLPGQILARLDLAFHAIEIGAPPLLRIKARGETSH